MGPGIKRVGAAPRKHISGKFQLVLAIYILATGSLPIIIQAMLYGLQGSSQNEFALTVFTETARDLLLLAPVIALSNQPLGILHPLLIAVVAWPLISVMPSVIQDYGGWGGVIVGQPVRTPHFYGMPSASGGMVWLAMAKYNFVDMLRLGGVYLGFAAAGIPQLQKKSTTLLRSDGVRTVMLVFMAISTAILMVFVRSRGGVGEHLTSLANGRFKEIGTAGPVIVAIHLQVIALSVWVAARPRDVKSPLFIAALAVVVIGQFISNGSRSAALSTPLLVALVWSLRTQQVPWRLAIILAPVLFISLGLLGTVRTAAWTDQTAGQAFSGTSFSQSLQNVQAEIEERRALLTAMPIVERSFDLTGPLLGKTYFSAVVAAIPRGIWAGKPRGPDSLYAQVFLNESGSGRGIPVGQTEELYWNFGLIGVVVFSALYGLLLKKAYLGFCARFPNPLSIVFFALVVTSFSFSTEALVGFQQQIALLGICALGISIFVPKAEAQSPIAGGASNAAFFRRPRPPLTATRS